MKHTTITLHNNTEYDHHKLLISDHLFLQLAELSIHGLQADSCLLELLMCCSDQMAAPVRRLTGVFQLKERNNKVEHE